MAVLFEDVLRIHNEANRLSELIQMSDSLVQSRRWGTGGSSMVYIARTDANTQWKIASSIRPGRTG